MTDLSKTKIDWNEFKCRCSGIHKILSNGKGNPQLTEKQAVELSELEAKEKLTLKQTEKMLELRARKENIGKVSLSDSCISYLTEVYAWEKYGMIHTPKEFYEIDQLKKGRMGEEDSITLISILDGILYAKNDDKVCNDFLSGIPDVFTGDNIMNADKIIDIKTAFDYPSFLKKLFEGISTNYKLQIQGYMDITGATEGELAYCLVDMPEVMVLDYKKKLFYRMNVATEENLDFKEAWEVIERSMKFGSIPAHQRAYRQKIEPLSEIERLRIYDRVKVCREWLWNFDEKMETMDFVEENLEIRAECPTLP